MATAKKKTFYITTAIDYVNANPHLGHAYEKIFTDVIARYHRLLGEDVFYLTGTDENAQKNAKVAKEKGIPIKKFVDDNSKKFIALCKLLELSNDDFIRTTEERHVKKAQKIFEILYKKGDIYKSKYSGLYCEGCEGFKTEKDLVDGKCPEHNKEPKEISEEAYFFKMSKYSKEILKLVQSKTFIVPEDKRNEIIERIKSEGLKDLCVSRVGLDWGVDVPFDKKHKIYVWIDALSNYITALGWPDGKNYKKFWPADAHVIGKGINWFHSVIWPSILLSAKIPLPKTILVHGYVNIEGEKMSKTLGNIIDPVELTNKYSADVLKYYLMRTIPFQQDGNFSEKHLVERNNSELADKLGNLVSRIAGLIEKSGTLKKDTTDKELAKKLNLKKIIGYYNNYEIDKALNEIFFFIDECNLYVQKKEPWKLSGKELNKILYSASDAIRIISILLSPIIPDSCEKIAKIFGFKIDSIKNAKFDLYKPGNKIKKEVLFNKIEDKMAKKEIKKGVKPAIKSVIKPVIKTITLDVEQKTAPVKIEGVKSLNEITKSKEFSSIRYDDFAKLDIRVAKILNVKPHPNADKLLLLEMDLGFEKRTLVAGLKEYYKPEQLIGKKVIVLVNLEGKELRGVMSKGMILAAVSSDRKIITILQPEKDIPVGSKIS